MKLLIILFLFSGLFSCDDSNSSEGRRNAGLAYAISILRTPDFYYPECSNINLSTQLALSNPVTINTNIANSYQYRYSINSSGFKYRFSVSADYPSCALKLSIYNCQNPILNASNSIVNCDLGNYSTFISGGTQTCNIPSFTNGTTIININTVSFSSPSNPCQNFTFEVLP